MMETVKINFLEHRGKRWIQVEDIPSADFTRLMKKTGGFYSRTYKSWLYGCVQKVYEKLITGLRGNYRVNDTHLRRTLEARRNDGQPSGEKKDEPSAVILYPSRLPDKKKFRGLKAGSLISNVNRHVLPEMKEKLVLKGYSPSTIRTYLNEMSQLLKLLEDIPADNLQPAHLRRYLVFCMEKLGLRENTLHSRINALKFYYEQVLGREKFFWSIPRPKKQLILPKILSDAEIGRMFRSVTNIKHKAILFTAYSAGLRVSEVVMLKIRDIDSARMTLFIEKAKGKKDRIVNLSPMLLDILRAYMKQWKPRPKIYLFEGENPGEHFSIRSAQFIFSEARKKAGIGKHVTFHSLRHSFATHLLERGVDIRYIKDILGHFNIKTTERYTHVSRRALVNIESPLDDLFARGILL